MADGQESLASPCRLLGVWPWLSTLCQSVHSWSSGPVIHFDFVSLCLCLCIGGEWNTPANKGSVFRKTSHRLNIVLLLDNSQCTIQTVCHKHFGMIFVSDKDKMFHSVLVDKGKGFNETTKQR